MNLPAWSEINTPQVGWTPTAEESPTCWLKPFPYPRALDQNGSVWFSSRFSYLVQILHPAYRDPGYTAVSWGEIAERLGMVMVPGLEFREFYDRDPERKVISNVFDHHPIQGTLPPELIVPTMEKIGDDARFGVVWDGSGESDRTPLGGSAAKIAGDSPGLGYFAVEIDRSASHSEIEGITPNFWWPSGHSWCFATGVDAEYSILACQDDCLAGAFLNDARFDTYRLQ